MSQLFFTKAAALRILPFATKIEAIRVFKGSIQVTYKTKNGRCSTFLSKQAFYADFVSFRQEGAKNCTVKPWGPGTYTNHYDVFSGKSENIYTVKMVASFPMCSCPDFDKQYQELGSKAMSGCKHVMATIGTLGHSSLADYMSAVEARFRKAIARL